MSSKPETQFILSIHKHLIPEDPHREKNYNIFRSGTWDCWYSGKLSDLWIEYKYNPTFPIQDRFIIPKLSPTQEKWGNARYKEGRNLVVIVGYPQGGVIYYNPYEWSEKGLDIDQLKERLQKRKELAEFIYKFTIGV
jgi:hypothetical protein